jgi:hypothetical protein
LSISRSHTLWLQTGLHFGYWLIIIHARCNWPLHSAVGLIDDSVAEDRLPATAGLAYGLQHCHSI